jgi:TetR/AcrR family transcriptional regulator, cholesterol catabolism regulator
MSAAPATRASGKRRRRAVPAAPETRFDRRLSEILDHATEVFCDKGYDGASMRDLSRATGMSLAGLYHYFQSKERLLYLIQKYAFTTIVKRLKERLKGVTDPDERIRIFIHNHLDYFVANQSSLKVLAHEDEALKNGFSSEISAIKREYYRICVGLMEDLKRERNLDFNSRTAVMSLFGMINWIYTWYNPRVDGTAEELARQMSYIVLAGLGRGANEPATARKLSSRAVRTRKPRACPEPVEGTSEGSAVPRANGRLIEF